MRKFAVIVLVALSLGGCAQLQQLRDAISIGTASITNPVTKDKLHKIEAAVTLVFVGLNTWKQSCVQGLINASCKDQIALVQVYTRKLPPYLAQLREFVKNNDQVNAIVVYNNVSSLLSNVKAQAASNNVVLGN